TEEYQVNVFEHQLNMLAHMPQLAGMSPWILMDFRSPRRPLPGIQDYWNRKGLLSEKGERKKAFAVLQAFYRERSNAERASSAAPERKMRSATEPPSRR